MRVGIGLDVHSPRAGTPLPSGGGPADEEVGSEAGDGREVPICRAVADALLGAGGLGGVCEQLAEDEGGAAGGPLGLLANAVRLLEEENYQVVNVDVLVAEAPSSPNADPGRTARLTAELRTVAARLAEVVHTAPHQVCVRRSPAGGFIGTPGGDQVAVLAVVLVNQMQDIDVVHATMRSGG
ncbi:MAG: 2-C-methyl-D-erythritol 2,4-cyclodiphosphate synthase [Gemmatimonadota bacterium]